MAEHTVAAKENIAPDSSTTSNANQKASTKANESLDWIPVECFNSKQEAEEYIATQNCFFEQSRNSTKAGTSVYFYCSQVTNRDSPKCPVKLKMFESNHAITFGVSVTTLEHNHAGLKLKKIEFSQDIRKEVYIVRMQFAMKPKLIAKHLARLFPNENLPNVAQIRAILREEKKIQIPQTVSYGQLIGWCNALAEIPIDIDESFVLDHFYDGVDNSFGFVLSTKRLLQNAVSQNNVCADGTYKICSTLFMKKWRENGESAFCDYFESQWLQEGTQNWYCGYSPYVPAHNNFQEGFNNHVKRDHLLRERLPFETFKIVLTDMVSDMSKCYEPGQTIEKVKKIQNTPKIDNYMYRAAHEWINDKTVILGEIDNSDAFDPESKVFIASSPKYQNREKNSFDDLARIDIEDFGDFDEYRQNGYRMSYNMQINCSSTHWATKSTCSCSDFYAKFMCKHIVGLAFHLKIKKMPKEAISVAIEKKRPRGRASRAKPALMKQ